MIQYKEYKKIGYESNPFKDPSDIYNQIAAQALPIEGGEPELIVYTPDIERYADSESEAKSVIDSWILEHGTYEEYSFKSDMALGWNRLTIV